MALRISNSRQSLLQAEVLRDKITPVHPNDTLAFLLHTTMPVLLESDKRRSADQMGRNETAKMGPGGRNCAGKSKGANRNFEWIQWKFEGKLEEAN